MKDEVSADHGWTMDGRTCTARDKTHWERIDLAGLEQHR